MTKEEITNKIEEMENEIKNLKQELNKQEPKRRWKPKLRDIYFFIDDEGIIICNHWDDRATDVGRYAIGNVFKTQEEATFALEKLKVLAELNEYADDDQEWNKEGNTHWCIEYDAHDRSMYVNVYNFIIKAPSKFYFSSDAQAQKAIDVIGQERLKKYYFCVEK